uniref:VWFA domain-containing protein n=1 Tax=Plectus sambesii TaxID=2011161 RepID=A0A914VFB5_9BILA
MALSLLLVSITVLYFSPTACIPIDNGLVLKQRLVSAGPPTKVCNSVADVMFIVDGSTSIGEDNFEIVRIFLRGAVETLTAQAASTWYSTVQFSGIARTEFSFKTFGDDSEKVKDYFSKMPYLRGTTTIGKAIDYAIAKEMTAASGNREGIEDIVIVITDGRSSDDPKPPADRLRALGAQTFAIGITNAVDKDQLVAIAGSNDSVIFVTDFTKLDNTAKETLLSKRKCVTVTRKHLKRDFTALCIQAIFSQFRV